MSLSEREQPSTAQRPMTTLNHVQVDRPAFEPRLDQGLLEKEAVHNFVDQPTSQLKEGLSSSSPVEIGAGMVDSVAVDVSEVPIESTGFGSPLVDIDPAQFPGRDPYSEVSLSSVNINEELIGFAPSELESVHPNGASHTNDLNHYDIYDQTSTTQGIDDILYGITDSMVNEHHQHESYADGWVFGKIPKEGGGEKWRWHKHDTSLGWTTLATGGEGDGDPDNRDGSYQTYKQTEDGFIFTGGGESPGEGCWDMPDLHHVSFVSASVFKVDSLTNYRPEGFSERQIYVANSIIDPNETYDFSGNRAAQQLDSRLINHDDFLLSQHGPQGLDSGGMGYAEAVGLGSSSHSSFLLSQQSYQGLN